MSLKIAFIFVFENRSPDVRHAVVNTGGVRATTYAVKNYQMDCELIKRLVEQRLIVIEQCGGFNIDDVNTINQAANDKAVADEVRFDHHRG